MHSVAVSYNKVKAKLLVFKYIVIVFNNNPLNAAINLLTLHTSIFFYTKLSIYGAKKKKLDAIFQNFK